MAKQEIIYVIYDGGSIKDFDNRFDAYKFMDELENDGYNFECTVRHNGVEYWIDARKNVAIKF